MMNNPHLPQYKKDTGFTLWSFLDPTTVPGLIVYSFVAYVVSFFFSRWAAPIANGILKGDSREEARQRVMARREQREKEAQDLLKKLS